MAAESIPRKCPAPIHHRQYGSPKTALPLAHLAGGGGTGAVISAPLANGMAQSGRLARAMMALAEKKKLLVVLRTFRWPALRFFFFFFLLSPPQLRRGHPSSFFFLILDLIPLKDAF
jgi:hypothetical protein